MKVSFSLSSSNKPSSRPNPTRAPQTLGISDGGLKDAATKPEYVTIFDPSETLTSDGTKPAIAPLPNTDSWRATKRMKNLIPPPDPTSSPSEPATRFVLDTSDAAASNISYGLTVRSKSGGPTGEVAVQEDRSVSEPPISADQKFRQDMENLPDDRGFDEFSDISVEDFSAAVLAGYGWKEGQGIGRNAKGDTKVIEYKRRAGTGGLGFTPDMPSSDRKVREKIHEGKPPVPPTTSIGVKKKVVRVISGRYAGLKGEVLERSRRSDSSSEILVLRLLRSEEEVRVGRDMVADLGSEEEEKCLRKLKDLDVRGQDERREDRMKDKRRRNGDGRGGRESKPENGTHYRSSSDNDRDPVSWLRSHIRVRVISKDFKGGKLYLKKGKVMDVVGPRVCDLSMDETGELLQGVDQEILETVLPKRGGHVLVLYGRYKDVFGSLMEKDMEKETAVVQDAHNLELIRVRLEQIAEYVGDPSYIGY